MNPIGKTEQVPKRYGLGGIALSASDQELIGGINKAINSILLGVPEERQIELMDQLSEGGLSFELQ